MSKRHVCILLLLLSVVTGMHGQSRAPDVLEAPPPKDNGIATGTSFGTDATTTSMNGSGALLGSGDLMEISVFDTPELNLRARVDGDNKILLPLIGEVTVKGLSPAQLEKEIRQRLITGHFVKDPQVNVFVAEYAGQMVFVTGEVAHPGAYPLLRAHRLADLIALAGGVDSTAGNSAILTRKNDPDHPQEIDLNDKDDKRANPLIEAGDSIAVSKSGVIYVLGDVGKPGGFRLDRQGSLSVVQAIALAGGSLPSAGIRKAQLIHIADGKREQNPIDLKEVLASRQPDPQMRAGDILYIPSSLSRGMGRLSLQTILATASGIAIYSSYHY